MQQYRKNLGKVSLTAEGVWDIKSKYDVLSIVYDENTQHGFISKQPVPIGVDLYNSEYWMPLNVSGYTDSNIIILNKKTSDASIETYTLEEAVKSIASVGRKPGCILGFYNSNANRLDIGGCWEIWQFNSTTISEWEDLTNWQNIYYNYNQFVGWYRNEEQLKINNPYPEIGCYAYVGNILNEAVVYRCEIKHKWAETVQHAWDYVKIMIDGTVTVGENGNWYNNGVDTGIPVNVKGDPGLSPFIRYNTSSNKLEYSYDKLKWIECSDYISTWFRLNNNKLEMSRDNANWNPVSDYIAAWFRWQATAGDTQANNVGRIQMSRDNGKTWTNMSNDFTNNLHISRYIGVNESLPTSGIAEGTIYAKGPYYAEGDTLNDNPIYRLWVYAWKGNTLAWQDNGEFTSIAAGIVQETGNSETEVMSQKAVSEKLSELGVFEYNGTRKQNLLDFNYQNIIKEIGLTIEKEIGYDYFAFIASIFPSGSSFDENGHFVIYRQKELGSLEQVCRLFPQLETPEYARVYRNDNYGFAVIDVTKASLGGQDLSINRLAGFNLSNRCFNRYISNIERKVTQNANNISNNAADVKELKIDVNECLPMTYLFKKGNSIVNADGTISSLVNYSLLVYQLKATDKVYLKFKSNPAKHLALVSFAETIETIETGSGLIPIWHSENTYQDMIYSPNKDGYLVIIEYQSNISYYVDSYILEKTSQSIAQIKSSLVDKTASLEEVGELEFNKVRNLYFNASTGQFTEYIGSYMIAYIPIKEGETYYIRYNSTTGKEFSLYGFTDSADNIVSGNYAQSYMKGSTSYDNEYFTASSDGVLFILSWFSDFDLFVSVSRLVYPRDKFASIASREIVNIYKDDTDIEVLNKMIGAFNKGNVDVIFESSEYMLSEVYLYMKNTLKWSWTMGLPIGRGCRYYLNGSTISAVRPDGYTEEMNVFDTKAESSDLEVHDGTLICNNGVYCIHDECNGKAEYSKHLYKNMILKYVADDKTGRPFGCGTGFNNSIELDGCVLDTNLNIGVYQVMDVHGVLASKNPNNKKVSFKLHVKDTYIASRVAIGPFEIGRDDVTLLISSSSSYSDVTGKEYITGLYEINHVIRKNM